MEDLALRQADAEAGTEVVGVAKRRVFSAEYKRRILEEVDRARPGEIGLILRREGLYSSQLGNWRKWRSGVASKKKIGKDMVDLVTYKRLEKENAKLKLKLKITGWGWYYLETVLDDYSRYIIVLVVEAYRRKGHRWSPVPVAR